MNDTVLRALSYGLPAALLAHVATRAPANAAAGEFGTVLLNCNGHVTPLLLRWLYRTPGYVPAAADQNVAGNLNDYPISDDLRLFVDEYRTDGVSATFTAGVESTTRATQAPSEPQHANLYMWLFLSACSTQALVPGTLAYFSRPSYRDNTGPYFLQTLGDRYNVSTSDWLPRSIDGTSYSMSTIYLPAERLPASNGMIKLFGWEPKIAARLAEKREQELQYIKLRQILNLVNGNINFFIPVIIMAVTYVIYTAIMKRALTPSAVFSSMAVFDLLREQLHNIFYMIPMILQARVSLERVNDFLQNTELLDEFADAEKSSERVMLTDASHFDQDVIGFQNASFTWSNDDTDGTLTPSRRRFTLRVHGELLFKRGCFNLIIGPTGSGKTSLPSLLMALLGEMHFVPMSPDSWYHLPRSGGVSYAAQESWVQNETQVIHQCSLQRDLSLFDAGDKTEVGEKGLTLSGGRKARVTLARAVYSSAQILILDDVLAALGVHTARWIVEKCFQGDLIRGRTILLVTHNIAMASPLADYVVSLDKDGRIASRGSVSDALEKDKTLAKELAEGARAIKDDEKKIDAEEPDETAKAADGKLILAEEIAEGHAEQYNIYPPEQVNITFYLSVYGLILLVAATCYTAGYGLYVFGTVRASRSIHQNLIESVLGTTSRWLDTTPASRVITRVTPDIRALDGPISNTFSWFIEISATMLLKFLAMVYLTPVFSIPGIAIAVLGVWLGRVYMKAQIAIKREMSNATAPVFGHFGASVARLTSIRAYGAQHAFREESYRRIDRWISLRIDFLGGLFAAGLAAYLIYVPRERSLPSDIGFSLTMAIGFSGMILWWATSEESFAFSDLERIHLYINAEQEPKPTMQGIPPAYWPASGDLMVEKLSARYSLDGPKVLHDISFHIKSGERVGVELSDVVTEGSVYYDGKLTSSINLDALRSNITIIPQIPELLSGSLRENLDPFSQYDDATLNGALRASGLFSLQSDDEDSRLTLDIQIASGGSNLYVGQRQILALARAIVRGSKLLILDKDYKTNTIIQTSLRNELKGDVTLITVAHRLQTIIDADKVEAQAEENKIDGAGCRSNFEFGKPSELLKMENGSAWRDHDYDDDYYTIKDKEENTDLPFLSQSLCRARGGGRAPLHVGKLTKLAKNTFYRTP
ncbi:P-loop containing nucleoside triphosphate hydrolase protein [Lactarius psammicola]|nr:P-loop containing nucleoside triphosphate hydrolase protein [Lactarius psammicola]